jgi:DNA-directed RNA polymerase sigma subunit (sigma70/sigma32)
MAELSALEIYESHLSAITDVCTDPWFAEQLALYRAGDEAAWRRISASCLGQVLTIVKQHWRRGSPATLLDAVQEGNAAVVKAIKEFSGSTAHEFLPQMNAAVKRRIVLFLQHPHGP